MELKEHRILRHIATRWLSRQAVVARYLEQWDCLTLFFRAESLKEANKPGKATAILKNLLSAVFKAYFAFLVYILKYIEDLNKQFHAEDTQIHLVYNRFSEVYKTIASHFLLPSYTKESDSRLINPHDTNYYVDVKDVECGGRVEVIFAKEKVSLSAAVEFKKECRKFLIVLCDEMRKRFFNSRYSSVRNFDRLHPRYTMGVE